LPGIRVFRGSHPTIRCSDGWTPDFVSGEAVSNNIKKDQDQVDKRADLYNMYKIMSGASVLVRT
jgi:hypothetical protein